MMRPQRQIVAAVVLLAMALPAVWLASIYAKQLGWNIGQAGLLAVLLLVLVAAANGARVWRWMKTPRPKKRPTHLRIVRDENDTLH
jgi:hypothetical protein